MIDDEIEKRLLSFIEQSAPKPERYPEKKGRHFIAGKQFETEKEADQYAKGNGLTVYHTWRARMKGTWVSHKRTDPNEPDFSYGYKKPKKPTQ